MSSASLDPMLSGPALSLTAQDFFKCGGPKSGLQDPVASKSGLK